MSKPLGPAGLSGEVIVCIKEERFRWCFSVHNRVLLTGMFAVALLEWRSKFLLFAPTIISSLTYKWDANCQSWGFLWIPCPHLGLRYRPVKSSSKPSLRLIPDFLIQGCCVYTVILGRLGLIKDSNSSMEVPASSSELFHGKEVPQNSIIPCTSQ